MNRDSIDIFEDISGSLNTMEEEEKVDLSILEKFDILIKEFLRLENIWISKKMESAHNIFLFYLSSKNCEMILKKMKDRFEKAKEKNDNPKVVIDAEAILPLINDIYIRNINGLTIRSKTTPMEMNKIMNSIFSLREIARKVNMLPSKEEELRGLNKKTLGREFSKIDSYIGAMIHELV